MSFDEVRFPTEISFGAVGGPEYRTNIIEIFSGKEKRNQNWEDARARYQVAHELKNQTELDTIIAFFRARAGRARGFRFRDWTDYKLQSENIGTGDGSKTEFQITKTYTSGGQSDIRDITKIVTQSDSNSISSSQGNTVTNWSVLVDTTEQTETTDYTIDRNTGIITFVTAPSSGAVVYVNGEFDVPVRFDTDTMAATIDYHNSTSWDGIPIVEVRI